MQHTGNDLEQLMQQITLDSMSDIDLLIQRHNRKNNPAARAGTPVCSNPAPESGWMTFWNGLRTAAAGLLRMGEPGMAGAPSNSRFSLDVTGDR